MEFYFDISILILPLNQHSSLFFEIISIQIISVCNFHKECNLNFKNKKNH